MAAYGGNLCIGSPLETATCLTNVTCPSKFSARSKRVPWSFVETRIQPTADGHRGQVGPIARRPVPVVCRNEQGNGG